MSDNPFFKGNVRVYLEGEQALVPVELHPPDEMKYFIGAEQTHLIIKDFRKNPNQAAQKAIAGETGTEFADVFNQPAWVEVSENAGALEIDMREETAKPGERPILWLGVIRDGKMPVHKLAWEVLRPTSETAIAFAALVEA